VTLVSLDGEVVWRRALPDVMTSGIQVPHFSTDGATVFVFGSHVDGTEGIWAIPAQGGEPLLIVAFDDPELDVVRYRISVAVDRLYVTVVEPNTDIWVADVEVER
jgi:hypothetical protein